MEQFQRQLPSVSVAGQHQVDAEFGCAVKGVRVVVQQHVHHSRHHQLLVPLHIPVDQMPLVICGVPRLLIVDEVGYLPMAGEAGAALFQVVTQRYLKGAVALTTNLGIGAWGRIFDDPMVAAAMLDRLLHRSVVLQIDGESYRLRAHRARAEALRGKGAGGGS